MGSKGSSNSNGSFIYVSLESWQVLVVALLLTFHLASVRFGGSTRGKSSERQAAFGLLDARHALGLGLRPGFRPRLRLAHAGWQFQLLFWQRPCPHQLANWQECQYMLLEPAAKGIDWQGIKPKCRCTHKYQNYNYYDEFSGISKLQVRCTYLVVIFSIAHTRTHTHTDTALKLLTKRYFQLLG